MFYILLVLWFLIAGIYLLSGNENFRIVVGSFGVVVALYSIYTGVAVLFIDAGSNILPKFLKGRWTPCCSLFKKKEKVSLQNIK